jgi:hypothetical protein
LELASNVLCLRSRKDIEEFKKVFTESIRKGNNYIYPEEINKDGVMRLNTKYA